MKALQKCIHDCFKNEYAFGAKLLRYGFAILFILVAVKKLRMGYTGFADSLVNGDGHLAAEMPVILLQVYGYIIPAAELVAGVMLLVDQYRREAYFAIGIIYLTFIFGQMYDGNTSKIGTEYFPSMVALSLAVFFEQRAAKGHH